MKCNTLFPFIASLEFLLPYYPPNVIVQGVFQEYALAANISDALLAAEDALMAAGVAVQ